MAATVPAATRQISYADLYERWEKGHWRATELDFGQDRIDWRERFTDTQRRAALWNYALFLHGEDSVADNLGPYIDAAPREEQKYFLATQQVDEARHAVFFARFMREVVEDGSDDVAGALARTRAQLTWGFRELFALLDRTAAALRTDGSRPRLAAAIALYHLVVEATVAQTGQHFIDSYLERDGIMPAFHQGMQNVAADEQRHIGFGVKMLADLLQEDPACKDAVADMLREATRYSVALFVPPDWDMSYVECFGSTLEELYVQGLQSLETKLRSAGIALDELPGVVPMPPELTPEEKARRTIALLRANLIGERAEPPSKDPEAQRLLFDAVRHSLDPRHTPARPVTIEWEFSDADPWHLRIENGASRAEPGRAPGKPDLAFRSTWADWVAIGTGEQDPRLAVARGRLRPKGNPLLLWRAQKMFAH